MASLKSAAETEGKESKSRSKPSTDEDASGKLVQFQPQESFADRRLHQPTARTYFYLNEAQCEKNTEVFLKSIDAVADTTQRTGLAAIKMTALGRPQLLVSVRKMRNIENSIPNSTNPDSLLRRRCSDRSGCSRNEANSGHPLLQDATVGSYRTHP